MTNRENDSKAMRQALEDCKKFLDEMEYPELQGAGIALTGGLRYEINATSEDGTEYTEEHRWQVVATDKYSSNTIIQVYLNEYADNSMEDAMVQPEEIEQDTALPYIDGPQKVNVYDEAIVYNIQNVTGGYFVIDSKLVKVIESNDTYLVLDVITGTSIYVSTAL